MASSPQPNSYSSRWFDFFHVGIPAARTEQETAFVRQACPLPDFARLLDVCCGMGRHARALAAQGYRVTGLERDAQAVTAAREQGGGPIYIQTNVRNYQPKNAAYDAAIVMSQSFGYFDADANHAVLAHLTAGLRAGGRLVLDLWNPAFFLPRQGQRSFHLPGGAVQESVRMEGDRLFTRLDYPDGGGDSFEFQTFSLEQMARFADPLGLRVFTACTGYDANLLPSADNPRLQFVLVRD